MRFGLVALLGLASCGYRPLYAHTYAPGEKLHVVLASSSIAFPVAADEVLAGVRDELSRASALAPGDGYPRCEVEVLRADEQSEGIEAVPNVDGRLVPQSRATRVGIVARAWIATAKGAPLQRDTGDVRSMTTVSTADDAVGASFRHTDALRASGRRVGRVIGARILGIPRASDE